ncbi:class III lanthionine synthetase LanKC N-terminal domain-containing protein [Streptomyces sp. NBC_00503]|uniref:class III lanthionine synthetase LanKC N-terminal domain-containing protein n=1 Tax=Streptomyces sp. NBC_00503 TaxID=2903659 RepID=UPI002E815B3E|nr:hypothetical protein [Streptomyces sp. NBC_00503]WUD79210.1 hypothetical protein OG490_00675 [Streptomyces sp. NBC_00503]
MRRTGPYILSDLRWGAGPVHLRYGSFTLRHCYDETAAAHPAAVPAERFPVPGQFLDEAVEEILSGAPRGTPGGHLPAPAGPYLPVEPRDWPAARTSMSAAVRASATPDREDRLVPGDIAQWPIAVRSRRARRPWRPHATR